MPLHLGLPYIVTIAGNGVGVQRTRGGADSGSRDRRIAGNGVGI